MSEFLIKTDRNRYVATEIDPGGMLVYLTEAENLADTWQSRADAEYFLENRLRERYPQMVFTIWERPKDYRQQVSLTLNLAHLAKGRRLCRAIRDVAWARALEFSHHLGEELGDGSHVFHERGKADLALSRARIIASECVRVPEGWSFNLRELDDGRAWLVAIFDAHGGCVGWV